LTGLFEKANMVRSMEIQALYEELCAAAEQVGLEVRVRNLEDQDPPAKSGLVRLKGRPVLLLHAGLPPSERVSYLAQALGQFDLEAIYLSPAARETIASSRPS